jgi:hypothetical protein
MLCPQDRLVEPRDHTEGLNLQTRVIRAIIAALTITGVIVAAPVAAHADPDGPAITRSVLEAKAATGLAATTFYGIKNQKSGKWMSPRGTTNQSIIDIQPSITNSRQLFIAWAIGIGYTTFESDGANKNLALSGTSTGIGTSAVIATGSSSTDQDWITEYKGTTGYFRLKPRKDTTKCLGVNNGSTADGAIVKLFTCDTSTNQTWSLVEQ